LSNLYKNTTLAIAINGPIIRLEMSSSWLGYYA